MGGMKLFKNPVFAVLFCLVLILAATFFSSRSKLESRYQNVCDELCGAMIDFGRENDLGELAEAARNAGYRTSGRLTDAAVLIRQYDELSSGFSKSDTKAVEKAIKNYDSFQKLLVRFPASFYADLLKLN